MYCMYLQCTPSFLMGKGCSTNNTSNFFFFAKSGNKLSVSKKKPVSWIMHQNRGEGKGRHKKVFSPSAVDRATNRVRGNEMPPPFSQNKIDFLFPDPPPQHWQHRAPLLLVLQRLNRRPLHRWGQERQLRRGLPPAGICVLNVENKSTHHIRLIDWQMSNLNSNLVSILMVRELTN